MPEDIIFFSSGMLLHFHMLFYFFANTLFLTVHSNASCWKQSVNIQHVKQLNAAAYASVHRCTLNLRVPSNDTVFCCDTWSCEHRGSAASRLVSQSSVLHSGYTGRFRSTYFCLSNGREDASVSLQRWTLWGDLSSTRAPSAINRMSLTTCGQWQTSDCSWQAFNSADKDRQRTFWHGKR